MLSREERDFISGEMKISLESIDSKLSEESLAPFRHQCETAISAFIKFIRDQIATGYQLDDNHFSESPAEIYINRYYVELSSRLGNAEADSVLDSIRHAFCSFAYNGLHQLFTRQENEGWYPKVILDSELKPNHIASLPVLITLYRGTDLSELESRTFGQSWTTQEEIARQFAFAHYKHHDWFDRAHRIVLKTEYSREFIYYAGLAPEYEVAIDPSRIGKIEILA